MNPSEQQQPPAAAALPEAPPKSTKIKLIDGQNEQVINLLDIIVDEQDRKALVKQELNRLTYNNNWRLAEVFAAAGYFESNGYNTPPMSAAQAMAKIEVGESWGLNPADSIRFVYIIGGKPAIEEAVFAARLFEAGWSWDIQWIGGQGAGCKGCRLFAERNGKPVMKPVRDDATGEIKRDEKGEPILRQTFAEFTEEQAAQIKVWQKQSQVSLLNKSGPWSDGRRSNMYYWRAVSQFRRWFAPNVIAGALTRDEANDIGPVDQLDVYGGEQRREVPPVVAAASAALKSQPAPAPTPASPPAEPAAAAADSEPTASRQPADSKPKPKPAEVSTLKQILKLEAEIGKEKWAETMQECGYKNIQEVEFEIDAQALLMKLVSRKADKPAK